MAKNKALSLTIQIAGKMDKSLQTAIRQAQGHVSSFSQNISRLGAAGLAGMGALAVGTAAAIAKCTGEAERFETQMGDVVKYVDGLADTTGKISDLQAGNGNTYAENYAEMKTALLDLSTQIPMTAEDLTRLAAAAGQSGKGISELIQYDSSGNLSGFLRDAAMMGTAMDISADQAGDWMAKWEKAFNMSHEEILVLADQMNYLGANSATTAAEIASAVNDAASLGQIGGIDVKTTAALADAMLATGVSSDRVANSIKRTITNLSKGDSATAAMKKQWLELGFTADGVARSMQEDSVETLRAVFQAINDLPKERQVAALSTLFGQWAIEGDAKIVGNMQVFEDALAMVNDPGRYTGSMEREFIIKSGTSESIDLMVENTKRALQIELGDSFLPVKKEFNLMLLDLMNSLRKNMPQLSQIANTAASLLGKGMAQVGTALEKALPYIQKALDYLANHGPEAAAILGTLAAAVGAMTFAPAADGILGGLGELLLGTKQVTGERAGGLLGLFQGGKNLFQKGESGVGQIFTTLATQIDSIGNTALGQAGGAVSRALGGVLEDSALAKVGSVLAGKAGGFLSAAAGNVPGQAIGGILGNLGGFAGAVGQILGPAASAFGGLIAGALPVVGIISSIIAVVSILGDHLEGIRGIIKNVFGDAGLAVFNRFVGKAHSFFELLGFGGDTKNQGVTNSFPGLFSGQEKEDGMPAYVQTHREYMSRRIATGKMLFENGSVTEALSSSLDVSGGGIAKLLAPLRQNITNMFGPDAGAAFGGLIQILQSFMSVLERLVVFSETTVKPIILGIFNFITQTVLPSFLQTFSASAPQIAGIVDGLGNTIMGIMEAIGMAIQALWPAIEALGTYFVNGLSVVLPAVLAAAEELIQGISNVVENIKSWLGGLIDFLTGVFTGNWSLAWEGIKQVYASVFEAMVNLVKTPINTVIGYLNKLISGINGLNITLPDWLQGIVGGAGGGQLLGGFHVSEIPLLAHGGFTSGPSIAGEAGREAVISFQSGVRGKNIETWMQAGRMLGMSDEQMALSVAAPLLALPPAGNTVALEEVPAAPGETYIVTFSPQITVQGNASQGQIEEIMQDEQAKFERWFEELQRKHSRRSY